MAKNNKKCSGHCAKACEAKAPCEPKATCEETTCETKEGTIVLKDEELGGLRDFDRKMAELKGQLADTYLQKAQVENQLTSLTQTLEQVRNDYVKAAKSLAKDYGVDMDKPNQGNWSLNLQNRTLTKVD